MSTQTASNINIDNAVPLSAATRFCPKNNAGKHPAPSTLCRWIIHGYKVNGGVVRLESIRLGRKYLTSKDALAVFFDTIGEAQRTGGAA